MGLVHGYARPFLNRLDLAIAVEGQDAWVIVFALDLAHYCSMADDDLRAGKIASAWMSAEWAGSVVEKLAEHGVDAAKCIELWDDFVARAGRSAA